MKKSVRNPYADDIQAALYKNFPPDNFLGEKNNVDHFIQWVTFFRRNLHRFATDYLGIKLYPYQAEMLYLMGTGEFIVIIASRASAKSFITALYCCCRCILYPNSKIVLAAGTKGQSKLLVSEKIQKELMSMSPPLRKEIRKIKDNQNEIVVYFKNNSTITVVTASENSRGYRSNVIVREEFRQIKKNVDDSVLSPFQMSRRVPCLDRPEYAEIKELKEETIDIYISSSWFDNGSWLWEIFDHGLDEMIHDKPSFVYCVDEAVALKHGLRSMNYFLNEQKKQDPITFKLEILNCRLKENQSAFFKYELFEQNQNLKQPWYPRLDVDVLSGKKNQYEIQKQNGEIRVVACDMAFVTSTGNDNSVFTCARLLPETNSNGIENYKIQIPYIESVQGGETQRQAVRIRQLFEDFKADYIVLDCRNAGMKMPAMLEIS